MKQKLGKMGTALLCYDLLFNLLSAVLISFMGVLLAVARMQNKAGMVSLLNDAGETIGGLIALFIALLFVFFFIRKEMPHTVWQAESRSMTWKVIVFGILFIFASQIFFAVLSVVGEEIMQSFGLSMQGEIDSGAGVGNEAAMALYTVILGPLAEEVVFRGAVMRSLEPFGRKFAIVGSSLLFAIYHSNIPQGIFAFCEGLLFAWIAIEFSMRWSLALHIANNAMSEILNILITDMGMEWLDTATNVIFALSLAAVVVVLILRRKEIGRYMKEHATEKGAWKCMLSRVGVIIFIVLNILLAILGLMPA